MSKIEEVRREKEREEVLAEIRDAHLEAMQSVFTLQEEAIRFARGLIEDSAEAVREQTETNRATAHRLAERSRRQRETIENLLADSFKAYTKLAYVPFHQYLQTLEALASTAPEASKEAGGSRRDESLPIRRYDSLNALEISREIERDGLSVEDLKELSSHERANKDRRTLLELFDRKIEKSTISRS